jgi:hypothetical protein
MSVPAKTYDLDKVLIIVNGQRLTGFGADAVATVEPQSNIAERAVSADGQVVVSRNNDKSVLVTLTFMETSDSVRRLWALAKAQALQAPILPMDFLLRDTITGDEISDQYCVFMTYPALSKARNVGEREFQLLLPNGLENMKMADLVAI